MKRELLNGGWSGFVHDIRHYRVAMISVKIKEKIKLQEFFDLLYVVPGCPERFG